MNYAPLPFIHREATTGREPREARLQGLPSNSRWTSKPTSARYSNVPRSSKVIARGPSREPTRGPSAPSTLSRPICPQSNVGPDARRQSYEKARDEG